MTDIIEQDLIDELRSQLPSEILSLPKHQQDAYLKSLVQHFRATEEKEAEQNLLRAQTRERIKRDYRFLHKDILTFKDEHFCQETLNVLRNEDREAFLELAVEETPGVYSFELFSKDYCRKMCEELDHFEAWVAANQVPIARPNSMNRFGVVLTDLGFDPFMDKFLKEIAQPITDAVFPLFEGHLDDHHAFVVEYELEGDRDLGFHVDDSEVTLNCCLGRSFEGGDLYLCGRRCARHQNSPKEESEEAVYSFEPGRAIAHLGRHRHGVRPLTEGKRQNLIVWCRSSEHRRDEDLRDCPAWCPLFTSE